MDADAILDRRRLKRRLTFWRIAAALAVAALVALGIGKYTGRDKDHVARLWIDGFIAEDRDRDEAIDKLVKKKRAKAVIVRINSPGGTTAGAEELYNGLRRIAEKKPVVAVIGTIGASGGYIVAIAADHIIARETSLTGSIGVLFQSAEFTGLMEKLGIVPFSLKSSPLKGQPSPIEPMTDEVRQALGALLDDSYVWFKTLVRNRRQLDEAATRHAADGRVFTGRQAVKNGLVDALGDERAARTWLKEKHDIPKKLPLVDVKWGKEADYIARLLDSLGGKLFKNERLTLDGLISVWHPQ
ncbi:MAG: signal peptide peptidase SppA [Alphaproteobacteria bacterium]|jgi:protease-4|nr:signal peptide peptidase SppA [Alphaproteobacteria bacterium]MDP6563670.1 signal peptide peptidase SppA [Alphaproteobacteria bacterium]MDP6814919.1 signal peptide peptidase SppA [Alphaproteobacteria bacterium]